MKLLKDLLVGYCDPRVLAISDRPIGETGLTARIAWIARIWAISAALRRRHIWLFGRRHFPEVFLTFVGTVDQAWLTELLRVMDRGRSNTSRGPLENLTVELCHERFQAEPDVTTPQKVEEGKRYNNLLTAYDAAELREFRNQQMFHLDLATALEPPQDTGNILAITGLLVTWFEHVGSATADYFKSSTHQTGGAGAARNRKSRSVKSIKRT